MAQQTTTNNVPLFTTKVNGWYSSPEMEQHIEEKFKALEVKLNNAEIRIEKLESILSRAIELVIDLNTQNK